MNKTLRLWNAQYKLSPLKRQDCEHCYVAKNFNDGSHKWFLNFPDRFFVVEEFKPLEEVDWNLFDLDAAQSLFSITLYFEQPKEFNEVIADKIHLSADGKLLSVTKIYQVSDFEINDVLNVELFNMFIGAFLDNYFPDM